MAAWAAGAASAAAIEIAVALIDGLAERNAGERNEIRIDRGLHQHQTAGTCGEQCAKQGRNLLFERTARVDVLGAFNVGERFFGGDFPGIPDGESDKESSSIPGPSRLEFLHGNENKLRNEAEAESEGGQQFHAVARVVPGVRPPLGNEDGHRAVGDGVGVERHGQPEKQGPEKCATPRA